MRMKVSSQCCATYFSKVNENEEIIVGLKVMCLPLCEAVEKQETRDLGWWQTRCRINQILVYCCQQAITRLVETLL